MNELRNIDAISRLIDHCMHTRSFRISPPHGLALSLHEWGGGEPTFLLIHGFGDGGFIWNEFLPKLASLGRAIAIDLRGHGDSDWDTDSRYSAAAHLSDLNFVIDTLDLDKIVLVGHSLGGEIAIRFAALHPERVTGLVIVDFGPELSRAAIAHIGKEFVAESRVYTGYSEYITHLEIKLPMVSLELRGTLARNALRLRAQGGYELKRDPAMGVKRSVDSNPLPSLWPIIKEILCPVLIIRGVASSVFPRSVANRMVGILPNGYLENIKLAGHAVMIDNPEDFAAAALSFIKQNVLSNPIGSLESEPMR